MSGDRVTVGQVASELAAVSKRVAVAATESQEQVALLRTDLEDVARRADRAHARLLERVDKLDQSFDEALAADPAPLDPLEVRDALVSAYVGLGGDGEFTINPTALRSAIASAIPFLDYVARAWAAEAAYEAAQEYPTAPWSPDAVGAE